MVIWIRFKDARVFVCAMQLLVTLILAVVLTRCGDDNDSYKPVTVCADKSAPRVI